MYLLLKMGIFQPAMLVYQRVLTTETHKLWGSHPPRFPKAEFPSAPQAEPRSAQNQRCGAAATHGPFGAAQAAEDGLDGRLGNI